MPRASLPSSRIGLHCTASLYGPAWALLILERFKNMLNRLKSRLKSRLNSRRNLRLKRRLEWIC
ncbi:hypothetical protein K788_0002813 [Paraburkholderia caribensis MBA4]|uniref:Uncharacterized protein n=1 Tax=Paraburkholderia caribensis MBA4 TaxID=1323664 RepID=A0A0N7JUF8_9BURK|nr:hypothetical protein K788_0002813 [Paraburkholderia caribensis MBA4]